MAHNDGILSDNFFEPQFRSPLTILIWLAVFAVDVLVVLRLMPPLDLPAGSQTLIVCLVTAGAFLLWALEAIIYNKIRALFR